MPDVWKSIMFLCSINQFCDQFGLVSSRCSNDHASPLLAWTPLAPECIIWQTISLILSLRIRTFSLIDDTTRSPGGWKLILTNSWKLTSTCGKWNLSSWWNLMMIYFSTSETVPAPFLLTNVWTDWSPYQMYGYCGNLPVIYDRHLLFSLSIIFHCSLFINQLKNDWDCNETVLPLQDNLTTTYGLYSRWCSLKQPNQSLPWLFITTLVVCHYLGCLPLPWLLITTMVVYHYLGCLPLPWLLITTMVVYHYLGCLSLQSLNLNQL